MPKGKINNLLKQNFDMDGKIKDITLANICN